MFHEYAVDPDALRSWADFRYLIDQFGMCQGRLIAKFPSKWKRAVYEACSGIPPVERSKIEESLRRIDSKLYASGRQFDPGVDWIRNASQSNVISAFSAIITIAERVPLCGGLDHEKINDEMDAWKPGIPPVRRRAQDMADAAEMLLRSASEIVFVDQHYSCAARHGRPLAAFLNYALAGGAPKRLEYHLGDKGTAEWFSDKLLGQVKFFDLPDGLALTFYRWKERPGGEEFHARYILTDLGGIRYDVGLDESDDPDGKQTTDVSALDPETYQHRWSEYRPDSKEFDLVDAWQVMNGGLTRIFR